MLSTLQTLWLPSNSSNEPDSQLPASEGLCTCCFCVQHSPKPVFPELMPTHPSKLSSNVTSSGKPSGIPQPRSNFSATVSHSIMFLSFVEIISVYNCVSPLDHKLYESKSVCGVCQMRHTIFECIWWHIFELCTYGINFYKYNSNATLSTEVPNQPILILRKKTKNTI